MYTLSIRFFSPSFNFFFFLPLSFPFPPLSPVLCFSSKRPLSPPFRQWHHVPFKPPKFHIQQFQNYFISFITPTEKNAREKSECGKGKKCRLRRKRRRAIDERRWRIHVEWPIITRLIKQNKNHDSFWTTYDTDAWKQWQE